MSYYLGIYRFGAPFPADVVIRTLSILGRRLPDFFPASLPVTRSRAARISSPGDFDPTLIPASFSLKHFDARLIPIYGNNETELEILDDRAPATSPANVLLTFGEAPPPHALIEELLRDLIAAFQPDQALVTDNDTPIEADVEERRFHIEAAKVPPWFSWITWLNPGLLEAAGPEALARLSALCHVRPLAGGALVRVQDEPTRGDDPEWSRRRQAAEDAFGLESLHRRFPRIVPGAD